MEGFNKILIFGLFLFLAIDQCLSAGVTSDQMASAGKLMRDVCQPKFPKMSNDVADNIKNGQFPDDKDVKCYINCIMEMMQAMKKGKFNYESSIKQIDILLPEEVREDYRNGLNACKGVVDGVKNHCEAAMTLLKCLHGKIPNFMFP